MLAGEGGVQHKNIVVYTGFFAAYKSLFSQVPGIN